MKLFNEDCLEVMKQLPDKSVDCIVSDPPFGVNYKNKIYNDGHDYILNNMNQWLSEMFRVLKDDGFCFLFVGVKTIHEWINASIESGFNYKNIIATSTYHSDKLRIKNNFNFQLQPIIVLSKGNGREFNKVDFIPTSASWLKDKRNPNPKPYTYDYPDFIKPEWSFSTIKRKKGERLHPNEKNVDLIKFLIEVTTNENDIVMDTFMGCGSTGIACKKCNRDFIGIELDKHYFDLAKERIDECK